MTAASTLAAIVLACAFGWAAAAKSLRFGDWRLALSAYRIPSAAQPVVLLGVPLLESVVVVLLLAGPLKSGAALAAALVAAFSMAIVRARALQGERGDRLPCGCFGGAGARDYRAMLIRNGVLAGLAGMVLLSTVERGVLEELQGVSVRDMVPITLIGVAAMLSLWMVRQVANALRGRQP
jgi:Methylamine utilisation protein MauE